MSWSVHLNDRKAAYHVPHRQATDICHLQSFIFPPSPPLAPASPTYTYTHSHTLHTLFWRRVPTSKASLPLISLITQTVRSSTSPSSTARREWKEWDGAKKGKGRQRGRFIHLGGLICSERCCFGSKNFPLTRVQLILWNGCPLSRSDGTIPLVCRLGDESVMLRKRERWKCCRQLKNSRYHLQPLSGVVLSIFIHFPLIIVNVAHAVSPTAIIIIIIYTSATHHSHHNLLHHPHCSLVIWVIWCTNTVIIIMVQVNIEWLLKSGGVSLETRAVNACICIKLKKKYIHNV